MTDRTPMDPAPLRLERIFDASAEKVFEAWTSPEVLRRWWPAGSDWETPVAEVDARVGGRLRLVMRSPDGEEFGGRGEYVEITPPERLVFTWTWAGHEGHEGTQLVEVDFREREDGRTTVVLTNRGLEDEESRHKHRRGWEGSFNNLERVLAE
jgi:uncharacterized protein YndB with AHSA1/START domain